MRSGIAPCSRKPPDKAVAIAATASPSWTPCTSSPTPTAPVTGACSRYPTPGCANWAAHHGWRWTRRGTSGRPSACGARTTTSTTGRTANERPTPRRRPAPERTAAARRSHPGGPLGLNPQPSTLDRSVEEVPRPREVHRHARLLRRLDDQLVADRTAGLDHGLDAGRGQDLQAVREREERVRGGVRAPRPLLAGPLDRELRGVDAVDLAHADADRGAVLGEQDRVGLDRPAGLPGEGELGQLVGGQRLAGRQRPVRRVVAVGLEPVGDLEQRAAVDRLDLDRVRPGAPAALQHADVLLLGEGLEGAVLVVGRDDDLGEDLRDLLRHLLGHRAVDGDHSAERGQRVAGVRLAVRLGDVRADRDAARVGVLDDRDARLGVVVRGTAGGVRVRVVVVRHLLAVQLLGLGEAAPVPST